MQYMKSIFNNHTLYDLQLYVGESGGIHGLTSVSDGIVSIRNGYPYCIIHGDMIKVSEDGIWRCCDPIHHGCYFNNK